MLDSQRLGKQRVECLQILATLTDIYKMPDLSYKKLGLEPGEFSSSPFAFCTHDGSVWSWNPHRTGGWQNHPAVKMWERYEAALVEYSMKICAEWVFRGYRDTTAQTLSLMADLSQAVLRAGVSDRGVDPEAFCVPIWWGNEALHTSHQSNLLRKDPEHYGKHFPEVDPGLPYVWPAGQATRASSSRTHRR